MVDFFFAQKPSFVNLEDNHHLEDCTLAAIDIGTNSIHMVMVRIQPSLPSFSIIAREKDTVRLGNRDIVTGELTATAMDRALAALQRCQDLAASFNADHIVAVATSAIREAPNGLDFLQRIHQTTGLTVDLISGQEEARRIYLGVLSGMILTPEPHVLIDIGGGSTELSLVDRQDARVLTSSKLGAVRLTQDFIQSDPVTEGELTYLRAYVRGVLERPVEQVLQALEPGEVPKMIGTSGTAETLAMIHAMAHGGTIPNPLQGYTFSRDDLAIMVQDLAKLSAVARAMVPGMAEKRAEIIVAGAVVLHEAMMLLNIPQLVICERALREGIIVDWMLSHGLIEDRLRFQSSVRERSVWKLARKYQIQESYSRRIAKFALDIFDQTQGQLHHWNDTDRELLWAGALLHNCGTYISHSSHHKHSYYLIRNGELLGFSETELEIIANIARYHRRSKPKKKHDYYRLLPNREDRSRVCQLSAMLRLAVALDRRQKGAIASLKCELRPQEMQLWLTPQEPQDACDLELWSLQEKKQIFEEEFSLHVIVQLLSQ